MKRGLARRELDGLLELRNRRRVVALLVQRERKIEDRGVIGRKEPRGLAIVRDRLVPLLQRGRRVRKVEAIRPDARGERRGPRIPIERIGQLSLAFQDEAEPVLRLGIVGLLLERLFVADLRRGEIASRQRRVRETH